jgi:hypothetical protein
MHVSERARARTDGGDGAGDATGAASGWRVGSASRVITPKRPMRMAGFAARTEPSTGTLRDLRARAVAVEDRAGRRAVVVGAEVLAITRDLRADVAQRCRDDLGVDPDALLLNASHTHYGPEFRRVKFEIYGMDGEERARGAAYRERLEDELVAVVADALDDLAPARLRYACGRCGIGANRRLPDEDGVHMRQNPDGPVDHDVPVLAAYRDERPVALLFGYACHPTCAPAMREYHGDWPGFAAADLESEYEDATALFLQGCGGDVKAYPQNEVTLSKRHGRTLSTAVRAALEGPTRPVRGPLRAVSREVDLDFEAPPPRSELEAAREADDEFERRHARLLLEELDDSGEIRTTYPYRIGALGFGTDLTLLPMAGEVLAAYSLRFKDALAGDVWPLGYSDGGFTYVPTKRALYEGGYEGGDAIRYSAFPGPLEPTAEERIVETGLALAERVGARRRNRG